MKTVTPWGRFRYAYLNPGRPDSYEGRTTYKSDLLIEEGQEVALASLEATCQEVLEAWLASPEGKRKAGKKPPTPKPITKEDEDGTKYLRVSMAASYERNGVTVPLKPLRVDGAKQPIGDDVDVGSGSRGRFAVELVPWAMRGDCGVKLRLVAAQITEIETGTEGAADMFEAVETADTDNFDD